MIHCEKFCRICGAKFIGTNGRSCYCSDECREKGSYEVKQRHWRKEAKERYKPKGKMRDRTCKKCGKVYRGHFNSLYCDSCLLSGNYKLRSYYSYRIYTESEAVVIA